MSLARIFLITSSILSIALHAAEPGEGEPRWWKGNLHTHSFWSDGDDFPEMITAWYQKEGYHFLAISDHNVLHQAERWIAINTNREPALQKYLERFGAHWVETRTKDGKSEARLKPLGEYRTHFERPGQFLLIQSEELTDQFKNLPIHMNASNLREYIPPQGGDSVREVMQNNVDAVLDRARATGQTIIPHLNHPNFHWGVTAEDLAAVRGERFFEVYNGHPDVHNAGDTVHASTDRLWDIALALRLTSPHPEPLYGLAVDDSHHYHRHGQRFSNAGRGWIMIRARYLTPEYLLQAMQQGDFYASSGVVLKEIARSSDKLSLQIEAADGVRYRTEFIGTRRGFDTQSEPVKKDGVDLPVTRRYSPQVGEVLAEVEGTSPAYEFKGDELYVRARVTSSRKMANPGTPNEFEMGWTQPVFLHDKP